MALASPLVRSLFRDDCRAVSASAVASLAVLCDGRKISGGRRMATLSGPRSRLIVADHIPMPVDAVTKVSRYAATNPKELVAEAWAEYRNSPQPREVARLIGELIERKAKERRNRT
jgi:hypothetical protein